MKFTSFVLLGLTTTLSFAQAQQQQFGLRAAAARVFASHQPTSTNIINTSVIVKGVHAEKTTQADMDLINESVVESFHQVYGGGEVLGDDCGGWVSTSVRKRLEEV